MRVCVSVHVHQLSLFPHPSFTLPVCVSLALSLSLFLLFSLCLSYFSFSLSPSLPPSLSHSEVCMHSLKHGITLKILLKRGTPFLGPQASSEKTPRA